MDTTKLDSLINPQVMADMIRAELEKKLRATLPDGHSKIQHLVTNLYNTHY